MGVPLPELLEHGLHAGLPYLVLERLPGTDLGHVYDELGIQSKRGIAEEVVRIQAIVGTLPLGAGYGFARSARGPFPQVTWAAVVDAELARSRRRLTKAQAVSADDVASVQRAAARLQSTFDAVPPGVFLDDTTTKNVIVESGRLRGIVDVDVVCYGDPLFTVALTRASLLGAGRSTDYTDVWCQLLSLSDEQQAALQLYTAVFCVGLLAELGHRFNAEEDRAIDPERVARLRAGLAGSLAGI